MNLKLSEFDGRGAKVKIYLVWERECFDEYDVIFITFDEQKAKEVSGENEPNTFSTKKNDDTDRWYEERELDKVESQFLSLSDKT